MGDIQKFLAILGQQLQWYNLLKSYGGGSNKEAIVATTHTNH